MKKAFFALALLLFGVLLLLVPQWFRMSTTKREAGAAAPSAARLVSRDASAFFHIPDCAGSAVRWRQTSLHRLAVDPDVAGFLERPLGAVAPIKACADALGRLEVREAFVSIGPLAERVPALLLGVRHGARPDAIDREVAPLKRMLTASHPAGVTDLIRRGDVDVETFRDRDFTIASAHVGKWYLAGTDTALLFAAIDRVRGVGAGGSLADDPLFRDALAPLPGARESTLFVRAEAPLARLFALLETHGPPVDPRQRAELARIKALAAGTTFDGKQMCDVIHLYAPGLMPKGKPLANTSLELATANTLLALTFQAKLPDAPAAGDAAPAAAGDPTAPLWRWIDRLRESGVPVDRLGNAFGPELAVQVDWPAASSRPAALAALPIADAALATQCIDAITRTPPWTKSERAGLTLHSLPLSHPMTRQAVPGLKATVARAGRYLLVGLDEETVAAARPRAETPDPALARVPALRAARDAGGPAELGFAYIDLGNLVRRALDTWRMPLVFAVALVPNSARYVDIGKLPGTESVARHLLPVVFAEHKTPDGILMRSSGTITYPQALLAAGATGGLVFAARTAMAHKSAELEGATQRPGRPSRTPAVRR